MPAAIAEIDKRNHIDVMVVDFQIPPHTAHDLDHYLRLSESRVPLIIHSSFAAIDETKFIREGLMGVIPKPGHREIVVKILERFPEAKKT